MDSCTKRSVRTAVLLHVNQGRIALRQLRELPILLQTTQVGKDFFWSDSNIRTGLHPRVSDISQDNFKCSTVGTSLYTFVVYCPYTFTPDMRLYLRVNEGIGSSLFSESQFGTSEQFMY